MAAAGSKKDELKSKRLFNGNIKERRDRFIHDAFIKKKDKTPDIGQRRNTMGTGETNSSQDFGSSNLWSDASRLGKRTKNPKLMINNAISLLPELAKDSQTPANKISDLELQAKLFPYKFNENNMIMTPARADNFLTGARKIYED
jgi:hypothetical protein